MLLVELTRKKSTSSFFLLTPLLFYCSQGQALSNSQNLLLTLLLLHLHKHTLYSLARSLPLSEFPVFVLLPRVAQGQSDSLSYLCRR